MPELLDRITRCMASRPTPRRSQSGQGLVEYGLILILVSIAVVVALTALGGQLGTVFNSISSTL